MMDFICNNWSSKEELDFYNDNEEVIEFFNSHEHQEKIDTFKVGLFEVPKMGGFELGREDPPSTPIKKAFLTSEVMCTSPYIASYKLRQVVSFDDNADDYEHTSDQNLPTKCAEQSDEPSKEAKDAKDVDL